MTNARPDPSLRATAGRRVLDGFGRAVRAACPTLAPRDEAELLAILARARAEGVTVGFRGAGRSYGDAALNQAGIVLDLRGLGGMLSWDPSSGIAEARGGLTIEGLWRHTLADGFWPAVVPGTMAPTLGGCLSTNVHGKNNFKVGPIGDHVLELDLVTAAGEKLRCSREVNADVFHAAIGGLGLLGAVTRVKLALKRVESGNLRVIPSVGRSLEEIFDLFERQLPESDYLVAWLDCFPGGSALGRGVIHRANYLHEGEDPGGRASLQVEKQGLPARILGFPKDRIWTFMRPFMNNPGVRATNLAKYLAGRFGPSRPHLQTHAAFAFLLDYVPNWRLAYGPEGFIQVQIFVPKETARATFREVLEIARAHQLPSYLGVMKRHRPDAFLLSHAVDGYSLAMDFRVTAAHRAALWSLAHELHARVVSAGGRFYFAKDAVLNPQEVEGALGKERLATFAALKRRLDPEGIFASDLARRALPSALDGAQTEAPPASAASV